MLTEAIIRREEAESHEHRLGVRTAFDERKRSEKHWLIWKNVCYAWHMSDCPCFYLWTIETKKLMQQGHRETIEDAILLLEVDPWHFRSGYLKGRVVDHLRGAQFTDSDAARLRTVILKVAQGRGRREFRNYCRLALVVWDSAWEENLRRLVQFPATNGKGKVQYLLAFLDRHRSNIWAR